MPGRSLINERSGTLHATVRSLLRKATLPEQEAGMGDVVELTRHKDETQDRAREAMVAALEALLDRARSGSLISVCFVAIPRDRNTLNIGVVNSPECKFHELIGAAVILSDQLGHLAHN
jgi:hypothetical protein